MAVGALVALITCQSYAADMHIKLISQNFTTCQFSTQISLTKSYSLNNSLKPFCNKQFKMQVLATTAVFLGFIAFSDAQDCIESANPLGKCGNCDTKQVSCPNGLRAVFCSLSS